MKNQLVTVCVFCLLCASHTHCSATSDKDLLLFFDSPHVSAFTSKESVTYDDGGGGGTVSGEGGGLESSDLVLEGNEKRRSTEEENDRLDSNAFISVVFKEYGDGNSLSPDGFERLLRELHLGHLIDHPNSLHNKQNDYNSSKTDNNTLTADGHFQIPPPLASSAVTCVSSHSLLGVNTNINKAMYKNICPILLYQYLPLSHSTSAFCPGSTSDIHHQIPVEQTKNIYSVWMYATLSIIVISLCGLGGVVVIPVMQKVFYQKLLQFLVALAIGTLCGDALLHLLPHAMLPRHSHTVSHVHSPPHELLDSHDTNMWRGLVAMLGIIFFYFMEKGLTFIADWRKRKQRKKQALPRVRVMRDMEGRPSGLVPKSGAVGEKLCKHKYSSYPYCYGEITDSAEGQKNMIDNRGDESDVKTRTVEKSERGEENGAIANTKQLFGFGKGDKVNGADGAAIERELLNADKESEVNESHANEESFTIIIREHETAHHGHSHQHGHVHAAPTSLSSVAWMVVMGDGLHNFADGMAIGAAFATNIPGGFSTALAVFFHELPHELGDFAVLLRAGMSAKQAVFYNLLSSVLCFVGMCLGVFLGHDESTTQWVFSAAAGMFLYIALVDMIPELTSSHSKEDGLFCQCALHFAGLISGVGTMLLIALYERDLKSVFVD